MGEKRTRDTARPPDRPGEMETRSVTCWRPSRQNGGWQPPFLPDPVGGEQYGFQARDRLADNGQRLAELGGRSGWRWEWHPPLRLAVCLWCIHRPRTPRRCPRLSMGPVTLGQGPHLLFQLPIYCDRPRSSPPASNQSNDDPFHLTISPLAPSARPCLSCPVR